MSTLVPTIVSSLAIEEKSIGTGSGRKLDWRWWQRHSRTLSLYPSQSFYVLKARNKKQIKPQPSPQENSIERNTSYPNLKKFTNVDGHRFFSVVWFCLFLCFFLHVSGLIASLYFYLRVHHISLLAPYKLCLSLSVSFSSPSSVFLPLYSLPFYSNSKQGLFFNKFMRLIFIFIMRGF